MLQLQIPPSNNLPSFFIFSQKPLHKIPFFQFLMAKLQKYCINSFTFHFHCSCPLWSQSLHKLLVHCSWCPYPLTSCTTLWPLTYLAVHPEIYMSSTNVPFSYQPFSFWVICDDLLPSSRSWNLLKLFHCYTQYMSMSIWPLACVSWMASYRSFTYSLQEHITHFYTFLAWNNSITNDSLNPCLAKTFHW